MFHYIILYENYIVKYK